MKCTALVLALAAISFFAAPAAAQMGTSNSTAATLHVADDTAGCQNRQRTLEERMRSCRTAIREGHFNILLELASLQSVAGDYGGALASIAKLTDRLPDIPTTYSTMNAREWLPVLQTRSEIYALMGKFAEAGKDGDEIQSIDSDGADAANAQCWLRAVAGRELERGIDFCNKAIERKPHIAIFHDSRGLVHFKLGKFQEALDDFNAALDKDPDMVTSRYGRGVAKLRLGDVEGGKKDLADAEQRDLIIARMMAGYGVTP
jgi:tetratricopeptide (TPR) repeat protein